MWDVRDRMAVLQVGQKGWWGGEWEWEWEGDSAGEKIQSSVSGRTGGVRWVGCRGGGGK